ncbi:MAG: M48 family metallopeptidase [Candidatus Omnitrophota bacterium]
MNVTYGKQDIPFTHVVNPRLTHAYITVDFHQGVILKSPPMDEDQACRMVLAKASWIVDKLRLVAREPQGDIVTGSRLLYLGRKYYTHVIVDPAVSSVHVHFDHSSFKIRIPTHIQDNLEKQMAIELRLEMFYRRKAIEKITPRVAHWMNVTGLQPRDVQFRKLEKRWGSCTRSHTVILNIEAVKLPISLIDYIVVHELSHIKHPVHSVGFYQELGTYIPDYREMENRITGMKC